MAFQLDRDDIVYGGHNLPPSPPPPLVGRGLSWLPVPMLRAVGKYESSDVPVLFGVHNLLGLDSAVSNKK